MLIESLLVGYLIWARRNMKSREYRMPIKITLIEFGICKGDERVINNLLIEFSVVQYDNMTRLYEEWKNRQFLIILEKYLKIKNYYIINRMRAIDEEEKEWFKKRGYIMVRKYIDNEFIHYRIKKEPVNGIFRAKQKNA